MAIFLTGGTGKTANIIAYLLQDANIPFVVGSRRGEAAAPVGMVGAKFDWLDPSTFPNPFRHNFPGGQRISTIYLVLAGADLAAAQAFIDYAFKTHQVKRFVLLAGGTTKLGDSYYGQIWQHLLDLGVEYCILRPTWFMGMDYPTFENLDSRYVYLCRKLLHQASSHHDPERGKNLFSLWRWKGCIY